MAVQYWINRGVNGRSQFVAFKGGYHGDTTGAMAVSDTEGGMHALFAGLLPQHHIVDLPDNEERAAALDKLLAQRAGDIAGIIVEPLVQGAGGMKFHDASVLKQLRALADKYDVLLIFDEIFTGFGRTGTMFACEAAGRHARHHHAVEGAHRRHAAAGGDDCDRKKCSTRSGRTIRRRR